MKRLSKSFELRFIRLTEKKEHELEEANNNLFIEWIKATSNKL